MDRWQVEKFKFIIDCQVWAILLLLMGITMGGVECYFMSLIWPKIFENPSRLLTSYGIGTIILALVPFGVLFASWVFWKIAQTERKALNENSHGVR